METARVPGGDVLVRARGDEDGPVLRYTRAEIEAFARGVRDGEFDDLAGRPAGSCDTDPGTRSPTDDKPS